MSEPAGTLTSYWAQYREHVIEPPSAALPDDVREIVAETGNLSFFAGAMIAVQLIKDGADPAKLLAEVDAHAKTIELREI